MEHRNMSIKAIWPNREPETAFDADSSIILQPMKDERIFTELGPLVLELPDRESLKSLVTADGSGALIRYINSIYRDQGITFRLLSLGYLTGGDAALDDIDDE